MRVDGTGKLESGQAEMLGAVASESEVGLDRIVKPLDHVLAGKRESK